MNYNKSTKIAHFYNEEGEQLDQLRQCGEKRIVADEQLELKRYLVEIGQLVEEEESVDDLFARLNAELGIEGARNATSAVKPTSSVSTKAKSSTKAAAKLPSKVPTKLNEIDLKSCINCDFLFTRDKHKKSKIWHDGILKFFPSRNLGEFWDDSGTLLHKKVMSAIKAGEIFETSNLIIEIVGDIKEAEVREEVASKPSATFVNTSTKQPIIKTTPTKQSNETPVSSTGKRKFDLIFTADKHKKNTKKWVDGRVEWTQATGNAVFFNEDGECFYKRILPAGQIEVDAEFESGQYLFQIGQEIINEKKKPVEKPASPIRRPMLHQSAAKKPKVTQSIMANKSVPMTGRSDSELLSLLLSSKEEKENADIE